MISIGLYDNLTLRLDSYVNLLKTYKNTEVVFKAATPAQLINNLELTIPDVLILLTSKPDINFKKTLASIEHYKLQTIAITTEISKWLIPNLKALNIMGYLVMSTNSSNLEDAIFNVSKGEFYCCNVVSASILSISTNSSIAFTTREREIIKLLIDDKSTKEIADKLCVSTHTISSYRKIILNKFEVKSTTGMVKKAIDAGLV